MTSLETLHEIVKRIERKLDKQNGTVAKLVEWKIRRDAELGLIKAGLILLVIPVVILIIENHVL